MQYVKPLTRGKKINPQWEFKSSLIKFNLVNRAENESILIEMKLLTAAWIQNLVCCLHREHFRGVFYEEGIIIQSKAYAHLLNLFIAIVYFSFSNRWSEWNIQAHKHLISINIETSQQDGLYGHARIENHVSDGNLWQIWGQILDINSWSSGFV